MQPDLINAYRYWRQSPSVMTAEFALGLARKDVAAGKARYAASPLDPTRFSRPLGNPEMRYFESAEQGGFRLVGYADELRRIDHKGWYCDDNEHATYRGAVLQLPSRKGEARFLAAYEESDNGGFVVDFSSSAVFREPGAGARWESVRDIEAARDAALAADSFAEREAEKARDWSEAWSAGQQWADLGEEIGNLRRGILKACAQFKEARRTLQPDGSAVWSGADLAGPTRGRFDHLCAIIRSDITTDRQNIAEAREKRRELFERYAFAWQTTLYPAFNEGAGSEVLKA